jgi:starch synthase
MPSMFEPGGIVQQEFFVAGTPVIAFKTGGLKDTVKEFDRVARTGNGFTFEAHTKGDFIMAVQVCCSTLYVCVFACAGACAF